MRKHTANSGVATVSRQTSKKNISGKSLLFMTAQISLEYRNHLRMLRAWSVTSSKFNTVAPQIQGTTAQVQLPTRPGSRDLCTPAFVNEVFFLSTTVRFISDIDIGHQQLVLHVYGAYNAQKISLTALRVAPARNKNQTLGSESGTFIYNFPVKCKPVRPNPYTPSIRPGQLLVHESKIIVYFTLQLISKYTGPLTTSSPTIRACKRFS
jgi:hypothetical protein